MKKKEYKTPRSKVVLLKFSKVLQSVSGVGEEIDGDAGAKRAYGRFAWDEDED